MDKDTKKNYQLYGRNDMIMLDEHNKIYGSLGMAEPYIVATKEGETLLLNGAKDNEPFIGLSLYGKSHQNTVAGNQLFDVSKGGAGWIDTETGEFVTSSDNYVSDFIKVSPAAQYHINNSSLLNYMYTYNSEKVFLRKESYSLTFITGEDVEYIRFAISASADVALERAKTVMLNAGSEELPWEPYTGGQPSPSLDYPQKIEITGKDGEIEVIVANDGYVEKGTTYNGVKKIPLKKGSWIYLKKPVTHVNDMNALIVDDPDLISKMIDDDSSYLYSYCYGTLGLTSPAESGNVIRENSRLAHNWKNGVKYKIDADGLYLYYAVNELSHDTEDCYVWFWGEELSTEREYKSQSLIVSTQNGLPGIPVSSGGNYTDGNGQQWISDEIDFKRGKYVKKVEHYVFDGSEDEAWRIGYYLTDVIDYAYITVNRSIDKYETRMLCNMGVSKTWNVKGFCFINEYNNFSFYHPFISNVLSQGVDAWKSWLQDNPLELYYPLETPIETDLTPEQITAYQSLHTNYPTTTVMNDEGAGMKAIYKQIENGG